MIRLATVFSGIGAIEHALERMELDHEIVFACDNGDVDILSKKINVDLEEIEEELASLEKLIKSHETKTDEEYEYKFQLDTMLAATKKEYKKTIENINKTDEKDAKELILDVIEPILRMKDVKKPRIKEYGEFLVILKKKHN